MYSPYGNVQGHLVIDAHVQSRNAWISNNFSAEELAANAMSRPCTAFAFTRQAPEDRWTTRIGGLPAWPAHHAWPNCATCGEQLAFMAQLDFRTTDLRPLVPGDVLLFHYCFECHPWQQEDNAAAISWFNESDSTTLIEDEVIPERLEGDEHGPFYGVPHIVTDYAAVMDDAESNEAQSDDDDERWFYLGVSATKIGGFAVAVHDVEGPEDSNGRPMRFLGGINSIVASDVPKIQDGVRRVACGDLMLADVSCICFWGSAVDDNFELIWAMSSV